MNLDQDIKSSLLEKSDQPTTQSPSYPEAAGSWTERKKKYVPLFQALFGELFGTSLLVTSTAGLPSVSSEERIGSAVVIGFFLVSLIQSFVPVSGAHFNPCVTLCLTISRRISPLLGFFYFWAQMAGATIGAAVIKLVQVERGPAAVTRLGSDVSLLQGVLIEGWMTSVLIFVIYSTSVSSRSLNKKFSPLPIAVTISALTYFGGTLTSTSMNPARSFGPALVDNNWTNHWVYWVGPLSGALLGYFFYQVTHAGGGGRAATAANAAAAAAVVVVAKITHLDPPTFVEGEEGDQEGAGEERPLLA